LTLAEFQNQAKQRYGDAARTFLSLYPAATDDEARTAQNTSSRDRSRAATYLWTANRARHARSDTFTYFWTHPLPGPDAGRYGAFHTSEVPYALNALTRSDRPFTDVDRRVADTMSSYWANFAANGNPNGAGLPRWPSTRERPWTTQQIGDETKSIPSVSSDGHREFFERVFADLLGPGPAASAR
jgi:para-nitrobenzyl esterase